MRHPLVITAVLATVAAAVGTATAADRMAFTAQLDRDAAKERVLLRTTRCAPYRACRQVVVRDGRRSVAITPARVPGYPYEATASARAVDVRRDGTKQLLVTVDTVGGTGSSPRVISLMAWTGAQARTLVRVSPSAKASGYSLTLPVGARVVPTTDGPVLRTNELLYRPGDITASPSATRVRDWRWDGRRMVLAGTRVTENG